MRRIFRHWDCEFPGNLEPARRRPDCCCSRFFRDLDTPPMAIILASIEVIMNEISRYVPITKAKNDLLELIRQVEKVDESVAVTKNGIPAAVILSMEKYAGLLETLEILSDEGTAKSLRTSIRQARKGKWLRTDEVFRR